MLHRKVTLWAGLAMLLGTAVGCGPPVLGEMHKTVFQPTAEVLLVNNPQGWSLAGVTAQAMKEDVLVNAVSVTSGSLLPTLLRDAKSDAGIGMYVIVSESNLPGGVTSFMVAHPGTKFELVTPAAIPLSTNNILQVVTDKSTVSYVVGYTAGLLAGSRARVGIVTEPQLSRAQMRLLLGGMYAANAAPSVIPVNLSATPTGSPTTVNSSVYGVQGTLQGLPPVVVTARPLTAAELSILTNGHAAVLSTSPQNVAAATTAIEAMPIIPPEDAVLSGFSDYRRQTWHGGIRNWLAKEILTLNSNVLPSTVITSVNSVENSFTYGSSLLDYAWSNVPSPLRQSWQAIISLAK